MPVPVPAPYMLWAKTRPAARHDLAVSNVLGCTIEDIDGARDALLLSGHNDNGYPPLLEAIGAAFGVTPDRVATASGAAGANFQVYAALLDAGDEVILERPGYDQLLGGPRLLGARVVRFDRAAADGFRVDPGRIAAAVTPRTRLIVVTRPHNPTSAGIDADVLKAIGDIASRANAHVLVDEVYLDASETAPVPATLLGDRFISTSSLTKSYGLAGLRCGWTLSSAPLAERIRRARDVIDGSGSIVTERLATLAFAQRSRLLARAAAILDANGAVLREFLRSRSELECVDSGRGTVLFPRIKGVDDASVFAERLLRERETAIVPGRFFEAPAHFRLGIGARPDAIRDGVEALRDALDARAWTA